MSLNSNETQKPEEVAAVKKTFAKKTGRWLKKMGKGLLTVLVLKIIFLLIMVGILIYFLWPNVFGVGLSGSSQKWQAVFLTSGQVYFGKVVKETSKVIVLKDVHYLQTEPPKEDDTTKQPGISVVKLGQEIHQPENLIRINKEHVLFVEDLRSDSQVIKVIEGQQK